MAISAESVVEKEKTKKPFRFPLWAVWLLIVILTFGVLFYFLFLQRPPTIETSTLTDDKEVLTMEDLEQIQEIIIVVNKSPIKDLEKSVPESIFVSPPKGKIGTSGNPFAPVE